MTATAAAAAMVAAVAAVGVGIAAEGRMGVGEDERLHDGSAEGLVES